MTKVYLDHDGGLDDFIGLQLLLTYPDVDLVGIAVTPADCLLEPTLSATRKILDLHGRTDVRPAAGIIQAVNPFPLAWRLDCLRVDRLPVLNQRRPPTSGRIPLPAHQDMTRAILRSDEPVTVLCTGPLTNLARCISDHPEVIARIDRVVFMGGAIEVEGNVDEPGRDGTAEWNVYWDPFAAETVWHSGIPIVLYPLDTTNLVPVADPLIEAVAQAAGEDPRASLLGTLLAMTAGTWESTGMPYCCWDSLTVSHLATDSLVTLERVPTSITTAGPATGRVSPDPLGQPTQVARLAEPEAFYRHLVSQLATPAGQDVTHRKEHA